jgi:two-component system chemotaxis response regulator CheB
VLPRLLARHTALPVDEATDGARREPGRIYVAPTDHHVLITAAGLRVVRGPRENGFRPAIDPLFRSAARTCGPQAVGVILSGALDDGSAGLSAIVRRGGAAIVQDPDDAEVSSMPLAALRQTTVDAVLPAAEIARAIVRLCREPALKEVAPMPKRDEVEPQKPDADLDVREAERRLGAPSPITCPACGGALWETEEDGVVRYACHVGHQYAPESLLTEQGEAVEAALWSAVRVLEQHAELRTRMADRAEAAGLDVVARGFRDTSAEYRTQAEAIRALIVGDTAAASPARGKARAR